jgi:hypothetical protein
MSDRGTADQDLFQPWLANSRAFFNAGPMPESMTGPMKEKCEALFAAWNRFARTYGEAASGGARKGGPLDPAGWTDTAGGLDAGGGFGDLWRMFGDPGGPGDMSADPWRDERDALIASGQWHAYTAALERYRAVMSAAWLRAFNRFAGELAKDTPVDGAPGWDMIQSRWQAAAEAELAAAQRSEDFLAAQRGLIRARLDCSALLRGRVERIAGMLGLPTRAEVDGLHQALHALKRELRQLRARLDAAPLDAPQDDGK